MAAALHKLFKGPKAIYLVGVGFALLNALLIANEFFYASLLPIMLAVVLIALFAFQDPVVAVINEGQRVLLKASRQNLPVGEEEIKRVVI